VEGDSPRKKLWNAVQNKRAILGLFNSTSGLKMGFEKVGVFAEFVAMQHDLGNVGGAGGGEVEGGAGDVVMLLK
jgi:hypothetical protein